MASLLCLKQTLNAPKCFQVSSTDSFCLWKREKKMVMISMCCNNVNGRSKDQLSPRLVDEIFPMLTMAKVMDHHGAPVLEKSVHISLKEKVVTKEMLFYGGNITENISVEEIGIVRFLRGKVFLVTGATGFLAKVLIEKILRSVPEVSKIYLLIKAKDKEAAMERLKTEVLNSELFKCLKEIHGESYQTFLLSKLVPVVGNISEVNLGMEVGVADEIANQVDIIVNSAGNTTFDERYDVALETNTRGPGRLMRFAKRCKGLKVVMHVSTAYVNGERQGIITEKAFGIGDSIERERAASETPKRSFPLLDIESEIKLALDARETSHQNVVAQNMKHLGFERAKMHGWQDTYVFTKAMGEMMIERTRGDIPVVILRPSIIESTYKEPIPGWIEGIRMLDPLFLYYGKGELTGFPANARVVMDTVPADMVVNAMLAAMVKHATAGKPGMKIYHMGSSVANPVSFQDLFTYCFEYFKSYPYKDLEKKPVQIERLKILDSMDDFNTHIGTESAQGNMSRRVKKLMMCLKHMATLYKPYTFYGAKFDDTNIQKLMVELSQEERRSFEFDVGSIDWRDYIRDVHIPGLMTHVLKGRGM